jgi:hypothetical protein
VQNAPGFSSNPQISNSILWGNGPDAITDDGTGSTTIVDSIVQNGYTGINVMVADPLLAPLAGNNGFTQTHALGTGSPAIDAGGVNSVCPPTDQRGITRPQGNACDVGSYESDGIMAPTSTFTPTSVVTFTSTPTIVPTDTPISTATHTPTPTIVPTVTDTPVASPTYTATFTAIPTITNTPVPLQTSTPSGATTIYFVATNGSSNASCGFSWTNPCDLQYALNTLAGPNSELWVKQGVYLPGNNRTSTFQLKSGVSIYGGFAGTETLRTERNSDPSTNNTVLSGDIGTVGAISDNVYHVVSAYSVNNLSVLDGITITGGNANGATGNFGGGLYSENSSPTLTNIIFSNNSSNGAGGGMFAVTNNEHLRVNYSSPILMRVVFSGNTAVRGGGLFTQNSSPILMDVAFIGNIATGGAGGGMNNQVLDEIVDEYSIPILNHVTFSGNTANGGGGMFNNNSSPVLTNVTFSGNTANIRGGAILNEGGSPILKNVTITANTAPSGLGGSIRNILNSVGEPSYPEIHNSILWDNGTEEITSDGTGGVTILDSVVEGGCPASGICANVVNLNPVLASLANNDGFTQTHALGTGSSAIDAGGVNTACPSVDQRGITRPQGSACDMGAYEYNGTAPSTPTPTVTATFTATTAPTDTPVPPTPTSTSTFTPSPTFTYTPTAIFTPTQTSTGTPPPSINDVIYLSSTTNGNTGSVSFADEDILTYNTVTGTWSMYFDGSDIGITSDVDAFSILSDGTLLLSLDADVTVSGLGTVDDSDLIRFSPTSLGTTTSGTFTRYFDGSDVGLTTSGEDLDAFGFTPDGRLIFSTIDSFSVPGVSGNDEDLIAFTPATLGDATSGTWSLYFDGSDVGLNDASSEEINALWIDPLNGRIYLSTLGSFSIAGLSGNGSDIFTCTPVSLGSVTSCAYNSYWTGASNGFAGEIVDALEIVR